MRLELYKHFSFDVNLYCHCILSINPFLSSTHASSSRSGSEGHNTEKPWPNQSSESSFGNTFRKDADNSIRPNSQERIFPPTIISTAPSISHEELDAIEENYIDPQSLVDFAMQSEETALSSTATMIRSNSSLIATRESKKMLHVNESISSAMVSPQMVITPKIPIKRFHSNASILNKNKIQNLGKFIKDIGSPASKRKNSRKDKRESQLHSLSFDEEDSEKTQDASGQDTLGILRQQSPINGSPEIRISSENNEVMKLTGTNSFLTNEGAKSNSQPVNSLSAKTINKLIRDSERNSPRFYRESVFGSEFVHHFERNLLIRLERNIKEREEIEELLKMINDLKQ